jgi:hypothetical protein
MDIRRTLLAAACVACALPASAEVTYDYLDIGYLDSDIGISGDGFGLRGSVGISESFFMFGQYGDADYDAGFFDLGVTELRLGAGWHTPVNDSVDFVAALNWERTEVSTPFGDGSDNGYGVKLGLRGALSDALELNGHLRYVDYGQGANDTLLGVGIVYSFNERVGLVFDVEQGDSDLIGIGLRVGF